MENRIGVFLLVCAVFGLSEGQDKVSSLNPICLFAPKTTKSNLKFTLYNLLQPNGTKFSFNDMVNANQNIIIVQGFFESEATSPWLRQMVNAYLDLYANANVIHMDWSYYSQRKFLTATCSAPGVGKILGQFIVDIYTEKQIDLYTFHIVGFSLGGQLSGFAGQEVLARTGRKIGKITGLDIVGIGFEFPIQKPANERLSQDDALDVVGIHTNYKVNGIRTPFGRVDFYINGGASQPSCKSFNLTLNPIEIVQSIFCSHLKATEIFIRVLRNEEFVGHYCPDKIEESKCLESDTVLIKDVVDGRAQGNYYVATKD